MKTLRFLGGLVAAASTIAVASCKDEILEIVPVATVEIQGAGGRIAAGQSVQYTAVPKDDRGNTLKNRAVSWSSSNPSVATVDGSGRVTGVLGGSAVITASIEGTTGTATANVDNPTPRVDQVDPAAVTLGAVNPELRVIGANFVSGAVVRWNGSNRPTTYISSTELRVTLTTADAAVAGSAQLSVQNPQPGSALTSTARTVNVEYPLPSITTLSPDGIPVMSAAFNLTVTGTNFFEESKIRFRGVELVTSFLNSTTLRTSIPIGGINTPGYAEVAVVNPTPGGGVSNSLPFAVRIKATGLPRIESTPDGTCALASTGAAYCWGSNQDGQIGDGTNTDRLAPAKVAMPAGVPLITISTNYFHTCGLDEVGRAWCWGNNGGGRLGDGSSNNSNTPVEVAGGRSYISISAGFHHTCAIEFGGDAWCWGEQGEPVLGDGSGLDSSVPVRVATSLKFSEVSAGIFHSCALATSGQVHCWGDNVYGQLGDGTTTDQATPVQVASAPTFVSLVTGGNHTCAIASGGALYCWGRGGNGQLGRNSNAHSSVPVQVSGIGSVVTVDGGEHTTCAATTSGAAFCWGLNNQGQAGSGSTAPNEVLLPNSVIGLPASSVALTTGTQHACALLTNGQIACWGANGVGQLGDGTTTNRLSPVPVAGGITFGATRPGS